MTSKSTFRVAKTAFLALALVAFPARLHAMAAAAELTAGEAAYCLAKGAVVAAIWGAAQGGASAGACLAEEALD